jgi:hypothetical protein
VSRPKGTCPVCKLPVAECLCDDEDTAMDEPENESTQADHVERPDCWCWDVHITAPCPRHGLLGFLPLT